MRTFKYGDEQIRTRDIMIAVPSMLIAIGIIIFPRELADKTIAADGWVSILFGGMIAILAVWLVTKLAASFPNQSFLSYASYLVTKPVAIVITFLFSVQGILLSAFEVRAISDISHQYLFDQTPIEVVALSFLLVVVYAVSGSRAGLFRLNSMFLPIIFLITTLLVFFSIVFINTDHLLPVFKTDAQGYVQGTIESTISFSGVGIGIFFFYISLVKKPEKAPAMAAFGMSWVVGLYIVVYLTCIAVFGENTTANIRFPLIELAKTIEIPGGFFERLDSVFFVIWIMAIFNTTALAFDVSVMALNSIFPKVDKLKIIFVLSPIVFFLAMIPNTYLEIGLFGRYVSYFGWGFVGVILIILWVMFKIKGAKQNEK
ncbi:GerAB/ArcD/ProY family transporter [Oceanobacillus saliphilus]|uniref:GerAB/ArcD/ProY family transporter n=1 Tax=Oceanobacillus saliphilus TaxID=2925834 RepID=UPI00201D3682|nr:endospore germination permease [Oceanobacillus saliphilus]